MNSAIQSLTFHSDGQKRSAAPSYRKKESAPSSRPPCVKGVPAYSTFRFARQTTVIIKTVIAGSVSEEEILVHSGITKHAKHVVEQLTSDAHAPRFRGKPQTTLSQPDSFCRHLVSTLHRPAKSQSDRQVLDGHPYLPTRATPAISRNSMTYPLRCGNTGSQRAQYHAKHLTITFSDRSLGGAGKKNHACRWPRVDAYYASESPCAAYTYVTALIVRNVPIIIRLIIHIPSLTDKLFKRRKIRATHRSEHNHF